MEVGEYLAAALVLLVIFLICRELFCWYWKINRAVFLLDRIEKHSDDSLDKLDKIEKHFYYLLDKIEKHLKEEAEG